MNVTRLDHKLEDTLLCELGLEFSKK
jgi:hypothetical protein